MVEDSQTMTEKRAYRRRSDQERINELEEKLQHMKQRVERRQRVDSPVLRDLPRVQRKLKKFAELALEHGRDDLANSTLAFVAGLDRMKDAQVDPPKRKLRASRGPGTG